MIEQRRGRPLPANPAALPVPPVARLTLGLRFLLPLASSLSFVLQVKQDHELLDKYRMLVVKPTGNRKNVPTHTLAQMK
jgi:hypothetical protein